MVAMVRHRLRIPHHLLPNTYRHVEADYATLPFPFERVAVPKLEMTASWDLLHFIGYMRSWSGVVAMEKALGPRPMAALQRELAPLWGAGARPPVRAKSAGPSPCAWAGSESSRRCRPASMLGRQVGEQLRGRAPWRPPAQLEVQTAYQIQMTRIWNLSSVSWLSAGRFWVACWYSPMNCRPLLSGTLAYNVIAVRAFDVSPAAVDGRNQS